MSRKSVVISWDLVGRDSYEFESLEEAKAALTEVFGHPVEVFANPDGSLVLRTYNDDDQTVVEGSPAFSYSTWLKRGANWSHIG